MRDFKRPELVKAETLIGQTLRFYGAVLIDTALGQAYQVTASADESGAEPFTFISGFKSPITRDILSMFDTSPEPFRGVIERQNSNVPGHAPFYILAEPEALQETLDDVPF